MAPTNAQVLLAVRRQGTQKKKKKKKLEAFNKKFFFPLIKTLYYLQSARTIV